MSVVGDVSLDSSSGIIWGGDTNLYRGTANRLTTDDTFQAAAYRVGSTDGTSVTCSGGQFLQNQVVNGGIVTGGSCAAGGGASSLQAAYEGGNTITTNNTEGDIDITLTQAADFIIDIGSGATAEFQIESNGTDILQIASAGQLQLDTTGSSAGILIGGDAQIYRSGSNTLSTGSGDALTVNGTLTVSGSGNLIVNSSGNVQVQGSNVNVTRASSGQNAYLAWITGDANPRFQINADGAINWGPGNASLDTNLYRSTANTLKTDDNFVVQPASNTTSAFLVQNSGGTPLFTVDSTNDGIYIGTSVSNGAVYRGQIRMWGDGTNGGGGMIFFGDGENAAIGERGGGTDGDGIDIWGGQSQVLVVHNVSSATDEVNIQFMGDNVELWEVGANAEGSTSDFYIYNDASGDYALRIDQFDSLIIDNDIYSNGGIMVMGDVGPSGQGGLLFGYESDTNLYRSAANTLRTDDAFILKSGSNVTSSLQVLNASNTVLFNVNSSQGGVVLGANADPNGSNPTGVGQLRLWGAGTNGAGSRIWFGDGNDSGNSNVWIGEEGTGDSDILELSGESIIIDPTSGSGEVLVDGNLDIDGDLELSFSGGTSSTNAICHTGSDLDGTASGTNRRAVPCSNSPGDIAEWYEVKGDAEPGDLLVVTNEEFRYQAERIDPYTGQGIDGKVEKTISKLTLSSSAYQGSVIGVVSSYPAQVYGADVKYQGKNPKPVALKGRVPLKVTTENGAIKPGDKLVASSKPGYAMKATESGYTIGTAISSLDKGDGMIEVFVDLGWDGNSEVKANLTATDAEESYINQKGWIVAAIISSLLVQTLVIGFGVIIYRKFSNKKR